MVAMTGRSSQARQGPTWHRWEYTIILYLSTAMAMMVREDMNTAMQGKVFTNLKNIWNLSGTDPLSCITLNTKTIKLNLI